MLKQASYIHCKICQDAQPCLRWLLLTVAIIQETLTRTYMAMARSRMPRPGRVLRWVDWRQTRSMCRVARAHAALRAGEALGARGCASGGEGGEGGEGSGGGEGGDRRAAARRRRSRTPRPGRVLRWVDWRQTRPMCRVARAHAALRAGDARGARDQSTMRAAPRCCTPWRPSSAS